ncbi:hypothetical protein PPL_05949 [Heterostelium album PN500]|uniref:C2 domain-containing protein n=1 Tax=Heterostelium pallidum (strain ATCC 26659 / Pp 5 / PN500) TaxID=670386 RepID=D3BBT0_HETP5|nr:hypothetical protein PPL_05949 [Heterostelium album PN500]EFA81113.1 hypothetical protein PPL_05949 [Heterostelium album PN500]|eukprot:XP_020433231.1 hypothetical protein PPL_05949 [Heterostelium album PN500]
MTEKFEFFVVSGKVKDGYDSNGLADVYVKIGYIKKSSEKPEWFLKTPVIKNSLLPHWAFKQQQALDTSIISNIRIEMWDHDMIGSDDFIGGLTLDVSSIQNLTEEGTLLTYHLTNPDAKEEAYMPKATVYLGMSKLKQ